VTPAPGANLPSIVSRLQLQCISTRSRQNFNGAQFYTDAAKRCLLVCVARTTSARGPAKRQISRFSVSPALGLHLGRSVVCSCAVSKTVQHQQQQLQQQSLGSIGSGGSGWRRANNASLTIRLERRVSWPARQKCSVVEGFCRWSVEQDTDELTDGERTRQQRRHRRCGDAESRKTYSFISFNVNRIERSATDRPTDRAKDQSINQSIDR